MENEWPWDKDVPDDKVKDIIEYCSNDVRATKALFHHLKGDWEARKILAAISGGTVNDSTNSLTAKLIFGNNRHPQGEFAVVNLADEFPGYKHENGISTFLGETVNQGGYVYAEPGIYYNVPVKDVESMHPTSIEEEQLFGPVYTKRFSDLKKARVYIKHGDYESAKNLFDGKLTPYLDDTQMAKDLSSALKTAINAVYGQTYTKYDNPFRVPNNVDNVVAKRGALFMVSLKHEVQKRGFKVFHIKTDSIKIANPTPEILDFVDLYGAKYGYKFEIEDTYERICLVNDAVYIAKTPDGEWHATGAQFAVPYVFKTLFSKEEVTLKDMAEIKSVKGSLYLNFNESGEDNYKFIGKVGNFVPVKEGCNGGLLLRYDGEKYSYATGAKGYRWMEYSVLKELPNHMDMVDRTYYYNLVDNAISTISKFGSVEDFLS